MHDTSELRRGFCPSVWMPMESGDGLIVRVRTSTRALSAKSARALARLAQTYGNGLLEITRRANVQLRGVSPDALPALQHALVREALADASPTRELVPALIVDPLAGVTPQYVELESVAAALEQYLATPSLTPLLEAMPPKLAVALDAGSHLLRDVAADIRIQRTIAQPHLAFLSVGSTMSTFLGAVHVGDVPEAVVILLEALSALSADRPLRMREARQIYGVTPFRTALRTQLIATEQTPASFENAQPLLGFHAGEKPWFGVALPFGAAESDQWLALCEWSERFGDASLRVNSQRGVLLTGVRAEQAALLASEARKSGLIVDHDDVLTRVTACVGAPGCRSAWNETRPFAARLAHALGPVLDRSTLHVSGCEKGCASSGAASITLIHQPGGCKIGLGTDVATTMLGPTLSPTESHAKLSALGRPAAEPTQVPPDRRPLSP